LYLPSLRKHSPFGFTIAEVLVAIGLLGMAVTFISRYIVDLKMAMAKVRQRIEISELRESIRESVSCARTLAAKIANDGSVSCSGNLALKDMNGSDLTTQRGDWTYRSICSNTKITIEIQKFKGSSVVLDPLTKKALDYSNSSINPLFGSGSAYGLCENFFKKNQRVMIFGVSPSELPFTSSDCQSIKPTNPYTEPATSPSSNPGKNSTAWASFRSPYILASQLNSRCLNYCVAKYFVGGYLTDCTSQEVKCVCIR
jgi:hypothetical protein